MSEVATPYKTGGWLDGLVYDEERRKHTLNGIVLPSVTQITRPLDSFHGVDPDVLAYAAERGTAVHKATELWDEGDLDSDNLDPVVAPFLSAWMGFRTAFVFEPELVEQVVLSKKHNYTGRLDRIGTIASGGNRVRVIIDIKSGMVPLSAGPQTAAYMEAVNEERGGQDRIQRRYIVQLKPDGTYAAIQQTGSDDLAEFLALLTHWRYMERHQ